MKFRSSQSLAWDDLPEGLTKVSVENCVDDGVEGRVDIAQPSDESSQLEKNHSWNDVLLTLGSKAWVND